MGHSRAEDTTVAHLESATLPTHGKTYTVVSHKSVIANSKKKLKTKDVFINFKKRYENKSKMNFKILLLLIQFYFLNVFKKLT